MNTNILAAAIALSDHDLLARIDDFARTERGSTAGLVAHLAALELRPSAYAARGYGSLFDYCTDAVRLSEDAACNRIRAARLCRQFPVILELLASGSINLSSIRILQPHLTAGNHEAVLARAANRRCREVQSLVAELWPQPDVVPSVRKLPARNRSGSSWDPLTPFVSSEPLQFASETSADDEAAVGHSSSNASQALSGARQSSQVPSDSPAGSQDPTAHQGPERLPAPRASIPLVSHRPILKASAPTRYRVQLTIGEKAHDDLRRVQDLLRREIPNGDIAVIFESALALLREKVEKDKLAETSRPRRPPVVQREVPKADGVRPSDNGGQPVLDGGRPGADGGRLSGDGGLPSGDGERPSVKAPGGSYENRIRRAADKPSRHIPNEVRRQVWRRDGGQCAFRSTDGRRCTERSFLELHHIHPFALDGPTNVGNISLRCRRHNQYEAEAVFGPRRAPDVRSG